MIVLILGVLLFGFSFIAVLLKVAVGLAIAGLVVGAIIGWIGFESIK